MIGAPITSVRSPPILKNVLATLGVDAEVTALHVDPQDLAQFMADFAADPSIAGLMVTMPHKRAIVSHMDALSEEAEATHTVNAVKRVGGRLVGAQFDGVGLRVALEDAGVDLATARIHLAGVGGAGFAIARALAAAGCLQLVLSDVDPARAAHVANAVGPAATAADPAAQVRADVLVNATPLGMSRGDPSPFDASAIAAAQVVADIVAVPNETRLAAMTLDAGVRLVTGLDMVRAQVPPIGRWLLSDSPSQRGL